VANNFNVVPSYEKPEPRIWRTAWFDCAPPPDYKPKDDVGRRKMEIAERPADERRTGRRAG